MTPPTYTLNRVIWAVHDGLMVAVLAFALWVVCNLAV